MATAAARGPLGILLQNSAGQYMLIGLGAYGLFPDKFHRLFEYSPTLVKMLGSANSEDSKSRNSTPAPIIIHTPSPTIIGGGSGGKQTWVGTITYAALGAGACWAGYVVAVQLLPDAVGQFLPVTRSIFDKTTQSLGKGILTCKQVLEEKIAILKGKADELGKKQDETNKTVSHIKSELGEARIDLTMLQSSMDRCEGSLEKSEGMQQYTLRGVHLLVRCVANMLPGDGDTTEELARFIEEEHQNALMLQAGPQSPDVASGVLARSSHDSHDIPIANAIAATPQRNTTPFSTYTPSSIRRRSTSSTPALSAKKSLSQSFSVTEDDAASTFSDIQALLGH